MEEKINEIKNVVENVEYIKLMKSETVKSGIKYNWDFKLLTTDINKVIELNNKLLKLFQSEHSEE